MSISIDSRLWLATHLLYPNSSQAFDVYQTLMGQSEDLLKKNKISFIFQKLYQIVEKIPAVNSNRSFHVFENNQTEQWQMIYKKSQKDQMVIFVGFFIFEMSVKDIASILKMSFEKTQFLFHQTFKKSVLTNFKMNIAQQFFFKKQNEQKISFMFTHENLIDYCLGRLSESDAQKVKKGLMLYPELQESEKQYTRITRQMANLLEDQKLRVTQPLIQTSDTLSTPREAIRFSHLFTDHKKLIVASSLSVLTLALVITRPQWVQKIVRTSQDRFVVVQEVQTKKSLTSDEQTQTASMNLNELPVVATTPTKPVVATVAATKIETKEKENIQSPPTLQPPPQTQTQEPIVAKTEGQPAASAHTQLKKAGGLYRGVLIVNDVGEVTPKITEKIVDIGAKKAGEVELGWKKSEKLSYYHFTLPENNIDTMKEFLSNFGQLQIQFENHPRLMPAGVKRLIIEVKERE